jgi:hypothetical protein
MLNHKVILLAGMARGGTNVAWNILQSHPGVCTPIREAGQIFRESAFLRWARPRVEKSILARRVVDRALYQRKVRTLRHEDNRFKADGVLYAPAEVKEAALCLKGVNEDIDLAEMLRVVYPDMYFVGITRNGYAVAEGLVRRGMSAADAGRLYAHFASRVDTCAALFADRFKLVRFEDVLERPFELATELFAFLNLEPTGLEKIRQKSKPVLGIAGQHITRFGAEERKYWFDESTIRAALDVRVTDTQVRNLHSHAIAEFEKEAAPGMRYFGYTA